MSSLVVTADGVVLSRWLSASVTRDLEALAGSFSCEVAAQPFRSETGQLVTPLKGEDACRVALDDDVVITGFVDRVRGKFDTETDAIGFDGRDLTAALVDCTPDLKKRQYNGIGVLEFCQMVADPFGIHIALQDGVSDAAISTTPVSTVAQNKDVAKRPSAVGSAGKSTSATKVGNPKATLTIDPGETGFSLIDRACRLVGLLPVSDGFGVVYLTRSSVTRCTTAIVEGQNLLDLEFTLDATKRYARYTVKGQNRPDPTGVDDDAEYNATDFSDVSSTPDHGLDAGVLRSERTLVVMAECTVTPAFANLRADWEAKVRAARSAQVIATVQGWRQGDGSLWPLNGLVGVVAPSYGIDEFFLISAVTASQSTQSGTRSRLTLTRADAFLPEPTVQGGKVLEHWWAG